MRTHNEERFTKRDIQYSQIMQDEKEKLAEKRRKESQRDVQWSVNKQMRNTSLEIIAEQNKLRHSDAQEVFMKEQKRKQQF